jgi:hypothetical protein
LILVISVQINDHWRHYGSYGVGDQRHWSAIQISEFNIQVPLVVEFLDVESRWQLLGILSFSERCMMAAMSTSSCSRCSSSSLTCQIKVQGYMYWGCMLQY